MFSSTTLGSIFAQTYPFSNTVVSAYNTWDSGNNIATALTKNITVSGVPTTGMILRQVNVFLGDGVNNTDLSSYIATLTDPAGNVITLFNTNYFYNGAFDQKYTNIHLRDHAKLKRIADYGGTSYLGVPYNWGYYRVETAGSFSTMNTTSSVNGTWIFKLVENAASEVRFNSVELIFGPPFTTTDITLSTQNDACTTPQCIQSGGEIYLATNGNGSVTYPGSITSDPPLTLGGCTWNGQKDNSAWFTFKPSTANVRLSISGLQTIQESLVYTMGGTCASPSYTLVACPNDNSATGMFMLLTGSGSCNASGNPTSATKYYRTCYNGGTIWNHEYQLSGLTPGNTYYLILDGQSAVKSDFYIEVISGADGGCIAPLGVEFVSLDLDQMADHKVNIQWTTLKERNNAYFEVQKSYDGHTFTSISKMESNGISEELNNYSVIDNDANTGLIYYRIKQVDLDGKESYSETRTIQIDLAASKEINLFPNPSDGKDVFIFLKSPNVNDSEVYIYDLTGNLIHVQTMKAHSQNVRLDYSLKSGVYFVKSSFGKEIAKLIIEN